MGFFDFVEQQHAVRFFVDLLGEQTAVVKADVTRRRADEAAHRVAFHVFGHVETHQLNAEREGQLARHFGFAYPRGAGKEKTANRLLRAAQSGAGHLDGAGKRFDGRVLTEDDVFQVAFQRFERGAVVAGNIARRNAGNARDDFFNLVLADGFFLL